LPPVLQGCYKFGQKLIPCVCGLQHSCRQESVGFLSALDGFKYPSKLFFEQIQCSQLRA
jgi:hypothetical protein